MLLSLWLWKDLCDGCSGESEGHFDVTPSGLDYSLSYGDITSILLPPGVGGDKGGIFYHSVGVVCRFRGVQLCALGSVVHVL